MPQSDGDHPEDQPVFLRRLRWVTSHYFCKRSPTGWIKRLYPDVSCRPARQAKPSLAANIYMGRGKCATGAAGVPDISSSSEGSALDPLPTEAAKDPFCRPGRSIGR